ncbi:hypothetical protein ABZP36_012529 [Zizania latifolia]
MAEQARRPSVAPTLVRLCFCLLLKLSSTRRAMSMGFHDDNDDENYNHHDEEEMYYHDDEEYYHHYDDDHEIYDDIFSVRPARRLYDGGAVMPENYNVLNSNSSNSSSGSAFCRLPFLTILDLSNNYLTGELPACWWNLQSLLFMDLSHNDFSSEIPAVKTSYNCTLESVHLAGNGFTGNFPSALEG